MKHTLSDPVATPVTEGFLKLFPAESQAVTVMWCWPVAALSMVASWFVFDTENAADELKSK